MPQIEFFEKRIDTRVEINNKAKVKVLSDSDTNISFDNINTRNISRGGVCMIMPYKVKEGNVLRVEIPVKSHFVKAFCEVQWCRQNESYYETGLSFIALKEEDIKILDEYIRENEKRAM